MSSKRILIVEDEAPFAAIVQNGLEALGYEVAGIASAAMDAIQKATELMPDVVLMDVNLEGGGDGIETAAEINRLRRVPIVFMTGLSDHDTVKRASATGPFGYLVKPFHIKELGPTIELALYKSRHEREREELLSRTLGGCVSILTEILAAVDEEAFGRSQRLKEMTTVLAKELNVVSAWELEVAAQLAQVGIVCVPTHVMQKHRNGTPLSLLEKTMIQRIPEFGSKMLIRIPNLENVARIVLLQDKCFDGTGFPKQENISGLDLPLGSRIIKVLNDLLRLESSGASKAQLIEHFTTSKAVYDPQIARTVITVIIDAPPAGSKPVLVKELGLGQVLKAAIETTDGTVLVAAGIKISSVVLQRLSNFSQLAGIKEPIYVEAIPQPAK